MLVPKVSKEENIQDHLNFPLAADIAFQILKNSVGKRGNEYTVTSHIFKNSSLIQSSSLWELMLLAFTSQVDPKSFLPSGNYVTNSLGAIWCPNSKWGALPHVEPLPKASEMTQCTVKVWTWPLMLHNRCQMQGCFSTEQQSTFHFRPNNSWV